MIWLLLIPAALIPCWRWISAVLAACLFPARRLSMSVGAITYKKESPMLSVKIERPMADGSVVTIRGWRLNAAERVAVAGYLRQMSQTDPPLPLPPPPPVPTMIEVASRVADR